MNERSLPDRTLTAEVVADAVKQYAGLARFSLSLSAGHSLRAGFLTSATRAGADVFRMMEVSRHKSSNGFGLISTGRVSSRLKRSRTGIGIEVGIDPVWWTL